MRQMKKKIILSIIITALLVAGVAFALNHFAIKSKNEEIAELQKKVVNTKCLAFAKDLEADSIITQSDIIEVAIQEASLASGTYQVIDNDAANVIYYKIITNDEGQEAESKTKVLRESLIGRVIKSNVSKNTLIMDSLLYPENEEPTKDERLQEFNFLQLPSDAVENDYIDIRIRFPDGEDYSVLIGKKVERIAGENTVFIKMSEEDIMAMGSAIIEAYMQPGVSLYANKYVDPATQLFNEAIVDYVAKYEYAVNRLIEEDKEKQLRRLIAEEIMTDADGNSLMDEFGNIAFTVHSGDVIDLEGNIATGDTVIMIPTTTLIEEVEKDDNSGEMEEVEVCYITAEALPLIPERIIEDLEDEIIEPTVEDFENIDIATYAGIDKDYVEEIRVAEASQDQNTLNFYKIMRVTTRDAIIRTYPVRTEVLAVIKNNPNLLAEIIAEFDSTALLNTRVDKYHELEAELAAEIDPYRQEEIKQEMEELVNTRVENVEEAIKEEIEAQRAERVSYLESLIEE